LFVLELLSIYLSGRTVYYFFKMSPTATLFFFFLDFTSAAEMWLFPYESAAFSLQVEDVWVQVKPVFEQLHAYVRRKLRDLYGPERISKTAPLPAHVLGKY